MLSQLKMGVDILPATDPQDVPHVLDPSHIPVYSLRDMQGVMVSQGPVDVLVERSHNGFYEMGALTLFEDEYPVFTIG